MGGDGQFPLIRGTEDGGSLASARQGPVAHGRNGPHDQASDGSGGDLFLRNRGSLA